MILGRSIDRNARLYPERPAVVRTRQRFSRRHSRSQQRRLLTLYFAFGSIGVVLVPLNFLLKPHDLETALRRQAKMLRNVGR